MQYYLWCHIFLGSKDWSVAQVTAMTLYAWIVVSYKEICRHCTSQDWICKHACTTAWLKSLLFFIVAAFSSSDAMLAVPPWTYIQGHLWAKTSWKWHSVTLSLCYACGSLGNQTGMQSTSAVPYRGRLRCHICLGTSGNWGTSSHECIYVFVALRFSFDSWCVYGCTL